MAAKGTGNRPSRRGGLGGFRDAHESLFSSGGVVFFFVGIFNLISRQWAIGATFTGLGVALLIPPLLEYARQLRGARERERERDRQRSQELGRRRGEEPGRARHDDETGR